MVFVTSKSKRIHIHMAIYQIGLETMINPVSVTLLVSILYFLNTNGSEKKIVRRALFGQFGSCAYLRGKGSTSLI